MDVTFCHCATLTLEQAAVWLWTAQFQMAGLPVKHGKAFGNTCSGGKRLQPLFEL